MEHWENPFQIDQIQLKEDMAAALRKHPKTINQISKETGIHWNTIKKFGDGKYLNNVVALKLQKYIDELGKSVDELKVIDKI